jgi:hypothetical protein
MKQLLPTEITASLATWLQQMQTEIDRHEFIADDVISKPDKICDVSIFSFGVEEIMHCTSVYLEELADEADFPTELAHLIREHWHGTKRKLCEKALLLENTFYKIQSGKRTPSRDTIICLALALQLSREEANHLLGYFGYALGERYRRDFIILGALKAGKTPMEVNLLLEQYRMKLLGVEV